MAKRAQQPIQMVRGDSYDLDFLLSDSDGNLLDLTGYSALMSVNSKKEPGPADDPEFTCAGTIVSPGLVRITPSATDTDRVGAFWYDLEITSPAGAIRTPVGGPFLIAQDITKNLETEWSPESGTAFDPYPIDGSGGLFIINRHADDEWVYNIPPGPLPLGGSWLGAELDLSDSAEARVLMPTDDVMPLFYSSVGYEWAFHFYCDMGVFEFALSHGSEYEILVTIAPGTRGSGEIEIIVSDYGSNNIPTTSSDIASGSIDFGGLCARVILDSDGLTVYVQEAGFGALENCWDIDTEFPDAELSLSFIIPDWAFPLVPELRFTPTGDGDVVALSTVRQRRYTG
jgi:hypothetical protein